MFEAGCASISICDDEKIRHISMSRLPSAVQHAVHSSMHVIAAQTIGLTRAEDEGRITSRIIYPLPSAGEVIGDSPTHFWEIF